MMYEKRNLIMYHEQNVNKCPHCEVEFVIFAVWGQNITEQVGPKIYCYLCGKKLDEEVNDNNPK